jgi:hypothetical protein
MGTSEINTSKDKRTDGGNNTNQLDNNDDDDHLAIHSQLIEGILED